MSGIRRVTQQQTAPLERLGVKLTAEVLDRIKWEAFWDAPLYITGFLYLFGALFWLGINPKPADLDSESHT